MTDIRTSRLLLHAIDVAEAERIVARSAGPADAWADDFPFEGDVGAVGVFLRATASHGEQRPFGYYRITRLTDGRAIGGVGFKGQPDGGIVEIGYGLAPAARGDGFAAEAVIALLSVAADHGIVKVIADTTLDNIASQRTLMRAGVGLVSTDAELHYYEVLLDTSEGRRGPMDQPVDLAAALARVEEPWSPRTVATLNDYDIRVVKTKGEFTRHSHPETDEVFLVLNGSLTICLDDGDVTLGPGQLYVVPRGVHHQPVSVDGAEVVLIEPSTTVNTGDTPSELTAERRPG